MFRLSPTELARRFGGRLKDADEVQDVTGFATDSRNVNPFDAYIAIKGANADGHDFAEGALALGASLVICERPVRGPRIEVESIVKALARFGSSYRQEFKGPVVGITGSNGKSTSKEMAYAALQPLGPGLKTEANRNTEYTSPLMWADYDGSQKYAVVEMGMRGFGQIAHLAEIALPTVGIITMIGSAHIEMVGSREGIAKAKGELLERLVGPAVSVLWHEDKYCDSLREYAPGPVLTFGFDQASDCRIIGNRSVVNPSGVHGEVRCEIDGQTVEFSMPYIGRHNALNASAALLAAHACGVPVAQAASALSQAETMPMRLQVIEWHGVTLLLDAYNASPDSTVAALRTLVELPSAGKHRAVLGEMKELGSHHEIGHRQVGEVVAEIGLDHVFLTGGATDLIEESARAMGFPSDRIEALRDLDLDKVADYIRHVPAGDIVLIKGSRALGLEKAIEAVIA